MRKELWSSGEAPGKGPGMATAALSPAPTRTLGERELIWMMALLMALNAFGIDSVLPALDRIAGDLGAVGNQRQLVIGIYLLTAGIGSLAPGAFADRFGRRPVLFASLGAYVALSLACALVGDYWTLVALRGLQGFCAAGIIALPPAIIRDQVGGDKMARLMSLIFVIFLLVPAVAPSIGRGILMLAGDWRFIFVGMAIAGVTMGLWVYRRLPETLHAEDRQPIRVGAIARRMVAALSLRATVGYTLGSALVFGALFGFINSSQQLIGEAFGAGEDFTLIFAICAGCMALANWSNSRIVERFGARRVSHAALFAFLAVSGAQLFTAFQPHESLWVFVPLMAANMSLLGFIGANFGSIALQPFRHIAGAASSAQSFVRMTIGALLGALIGFAYDGTARPLAIALMAAASACLLLVLFSERGRLFGPPVAEED
ncbi:MAG: MFS transporter [Porphyrobacter sp.]|nr:MFS transporter [Porphyrobacter sp.]